jgi:hypothetical protein
MYYHLGLVNESEPTPPSHITCSTKDTRRVATYIEMAEVNGSMAAAQYINTPDNRSSESINYTEF